MSVINTLKVRGQAPADLCNATLGELAMQLFYGDQHAVNDTTNSIARGALEHVAKQLDELEGSMQCDR